MKLEATTVDELFVAAGARGDDLREVDRLVTDAAPALERRLFSSPSITMIGYGAIDWAPDRHGVAWPVIGLTAHKRHISLYAAGEVDGVSLADHYRGRLGTTSNGKGCIRFSRFANVDREQLARAVRDCAAWADVQRREHRG